MSELPVDENAPGPSRPLSDFMSLERFAEFNAETRRLRREFVLEEEELAARALSRTTGSSLYMRPRPFVYLINPEPGGAGGGEGAALMWLMDEAWPSLSSWR